MLSRSTRSLVSASKFSTTLSTCQTNYMKTSVRHISDRSEEIYSSTSLADMVKTDFKAKRIPLAKICATIGPASEQLPVLQQVVKAGMTMMRLNFSHATYEEADLRVKNLHSCAKILATDHNKSQVNLNPIMLDTQGPEIRTGSFSNNVKELELQRDQIVTLTNDPSVRDQQTKDLIWLSYPKLTETVVPGATILLDDGAIELSVNDIKNKQIVCTVKNNGSLGNKKGVNLPGLVVDLPAMSEKDKQDIRWGIENDIDFIAASFTRKASDIVEIRKYCRELLDELHPVGTSIPGNQYRQIPQIIAKIESIEALENYDSILEETDAIMVARGDLGVEIPMETLANVQKEMIIRCNLTGKPVIVATQMLESMQKNPRPTRAECTDVANAVFDGADFVMLSGESAKGKYPIKSIETMKSIVIEAERFVKHQHHHSVGGYLYDGEKSGLGSSIVEVSRNINASCIIVIQEPSDITINIARFRPDVPIVAVVDDLKTAKLLQIHRGVYPILSTNITGNAVPIPELEFGQVLQYVTSEGLCLAGDSVVVVSSDRFGSNFSSALTTRAIYIK